jgi:hypothetical protein
MNAIVHDNFFLNSVCSLIGTDYPTPELVAVGFVSRICKDSPFSLASSVGMTGIV